MTSSAVRDPQVDPSPKARFQIEPITLDGRWRGRVLTRWELPANLRSETSASATLEDWGGALNHMLKGGDNGGERVHLKRSPTSQVFRTRLAIGSWTFEVVCKQSKASGAARAVLAQFRGSRERRTFDRGFALLRAGIPTALPLAVLERQWPRKEAWLITEAVPNPVDLERVCAGLLWELEPPRFRGVKRSLISSLLELCRRMADHHVYHRDFKASNVLVSDWDSASTGPRLWLVDLDGIRFRAAHDSRAQWRGIMRLAASLSECVAITRADYLRFLKGYFSDEDRSGGGWKQRWRRMSRDVAQYVERSRGRKKGKIDAYAGG